MQAFVFPEAFASASMFRTGFRTKSAKSMLSETKSPTDRNRKLSLIDRPVAISFVRHSESSNKKVYAANQSFDAKVIGKRN